MQVTIDYREHRLIISGEFYDYLARYKVYEYVEVKNNRFFECLDSRGRFEEREFFNAQTLIEGTIKWDGCSNWNLEPNGLYHACNRDDLRKISDVMEKCFDITKEYCPNFELQ